MRIFTPYNIQHLQLTQLRDFEPGQNTYLVLWWEKIPLGHLWIEGKQLLSPAALRSKVLKAVWPALYHYSKDENRLAALETYLINNEETKLASWLKEVVSPPALQREGNRKSVSVVICTRNRPAGIERCIMALMNSLDKAFEVIVVDNAPDDNRTEEVVKKFPAARYVREERKGLDIARNTGARHASHEIIAYTDDDVLVDENWVSNIKTSFEDPMVLCVTGMILPLELQTKAQYLFEKDWSFNKGYLPKVYDHRYFLNHLDTGVPTWEIGAGANMAFRREAFDLVGWFDERLDVGASGCSGDSEFWYRVLAEGWNCVYLPHVYVYHQHRETMEDLSNQLFHYMKGNVSALLVQYENYRHKGNLWRLYRGYPEYFTKKLALSIGQGYLGDVGRQLLQIKGCLSGWQFYRSVKNKKQQDTLRHCEQLNAPAVVKADTLVSVIIPCYNHAHYLPQAIESVLKQTYKNIEVIVVDDGSQDDTALVCRQYPHVRYVRVERVGLSAARNIGVQYSKGSYLVFLDADNWLYPDAVEVNLSYFSEFPEVVFVSGAHTRHNEAGNLLSVSEPVQKLGDNYWALLHGNYIGMEANIMYRRELFFTFHFDTLLRACEDYDLNLQISRYYPGFSHLQPIAGYRIHAHNMSKNKNLMLNMVLQVLKKQEPLVRTSEEKEALALGFKNWKKHYQLR